MPNAKSNQIKGFLPIISLPIHKVLTPYKD